MGVLPHINYFIKEQKNIMKCSQITQLENIALEYYRLSIKPELLNSDYRRIENILKFCETNSILNNLIIKIDIEISDFKSSRKEFEEYCNILREDTRKHFKEYFNQDYCKIEN